MLGLVVYDRYNGKFTDRLSLFNLSHIPISRLLNLLFQFALYGQNKAKLTAPFFIVPNQDRVHSYIYVSGVLFLPFSTMFLLDY